MNPRTAILRNTLRERVASWANRTHLAELRANVRRFLGKPPATEVEARAAIAYAIVSASVGSASLIDRFVAQAGHLPRAERTLFDEWARARFSIFRVTDVEPGAWIEVEDVLTEAALHIPERSGSEQIEPGMWVAAFVYETDGTWVLEGTLSVLKPVVRVFAVQAALRAYAALDVAPAQASPAATRRVAHVVYDAINAASQPPRFVNADGEDVELVTITLDLPWREVCRVLAGWPDADAEVGDEVIDVYGQEPKRHGGGDVVRAAFRVADDVVTVFTNSSRRAAEIHARWREATGAPLPVRAEERRPVDSNRDGNPVIVEAATLGGAEGQSAEELQAGAFAELDAAWPDTPIPVLDGLTPREAVAAGRRAEVLAVATAPDDELWPSAEALLRR